MDVSLAAAPRTAYVAAAAPLGARSGNAAASHRRTQIADIVARLPTATRQELVHALSAFADAGGHAPSGPGHGHATWL